MYSYTEEDYLKAIYKLSDNGDEPISTNAIAGHTQTRAASVTDMLRKLAAKKLVRYEKYRGVSLTDKGRHVAVDTVRKHRLWEMFLYEKLKFGWEEVHEVAEQLEHIRSSVLVDKLEEFLNFPTHDPHGDPIPTKQGKIRNNNFIKLSTLAPTHAGQVTGVIDHSSGFLKHLDKIGLTIGKTCQVTELNEFDGSLQVLVDGRKSLFLSRKVAASVLVQETRVAKEKNKK
jgi:DtxR family Mn-dependent transcriptional regulator